MTVLVDMPVSYPLHRSPRHTVRVYTIGCPSHVPLPHPSHSPPVSPAGLCSATLVSAAGRGGALTYRASGTATVPTKSQHAPHTFTNPPTHRVRAGRLLCRWGGGGERAFHLRRPLCHRLHTTYRCSPLSSSGWRKQQLATATEEAMRPDVISQAGPTTWS